jgi:hypothetical protein
MDLMNDEAMALDEQRLAMRAWKACKQDGQLLPPGVTVGRGQGYEYFHVQHGATPDAALRYYVHADGDVKLPVRLIEQLTETGLDILKARVCYDWRDEVELCAIGETGSAYAITLQRFDRRTRRLGHGRTQLDAVLDALEQQRTVETGGRDPETLYDPPPVEPPKDDSKPIRRRRRGNDVYLDPDRYERLPRIAVKPIEAARDARDEPAYVPRACFGPQASARFRADRHGQSGVPPVPRCSSAFVDPRRDACAAGRRANIGQRGRRRRRSPG